MVTKTVDAAMVLLKKYRAYLIARGRYEAWLICKQRGDVYSQQVIDRMDALGLMHPEIGAYWTGAIFHKSSGFVPTGDVVTTKGDASRNDHGGNIIRMWRLETPTTIVANPSWVGAPPPGIAPREIKAQPHKALDSAGQPGLFDKPPRKAMAIQSVELVEAVALVLGEARKVGWSEPSGMQIRGVSHAEFLLILDLIEKSTQSSSSARTFSNGHPEGSVVARATAATASGSQPGAGAKPTPPDRPSKVPLEVFVKAEIAAIQKTEEKRAREPGDDDDDAAPAAAPAIPDTVAKAGRMLDVVNWLIERGIKEPAAMVAECERLKTSVPFLARVSDMDKRIQRTLAAYHGG